MKDVATAPSAPPATVGSSPSWGRRLGRSSAAVVPLALWLFALWAIDVAGLGLAPVAVASPGWLLLAAALMAMVLVAVTAASGLTGPALVGALFLAHYGVAVLMVAIEVVYLDVLVPVVPDLLLNGAVMAAAFALVAPWWLRRLGLRSGTPTPSRAVTGLAWKLPVIGVVWTVLFVVFGALVFLPLARALDPVAAAAYGATDVPAWVLPFQILRGVLWVALALPLVRSLRQGAVVLTGLLFAVLMGANLLLPNDLLDPRLQLAHAAEVAVENFVFGVFAAWLLLRPHRLRPASR